MEYAIDQRIFHRFPRGSFFQTFFLVNVTTNLLLTILDTIWIYFGCGWGGWFFEFFTVHLGKVKHPTYHTNWYLNVLLIRSNFRNCSAFAHLLNKRKQFLKILDCQINKNIFQKMVECKTTPKILTWGS